MTDELLKEAIYAVALRDTLNKYPSGCFAQLYYNYIKNLDPKWEGTFIFYHMCTESARQKMEQWTKIVAATYPNLRKVYTNIIDKSTAIFESLPSYRPNTDEETKIYRNMKISHCINGMYYSPIVELDYTDEEFSNILRKMPEYSQIDFKKELEQIKFDRIKEDF